MNARLIAWILPRIAAASLAGLLALGGAAAAAERSPASNAPLTIGLIATGTVEQTIENWKPLTDALAKDLQRPVQVVASKNYADIASGMKDGGMQLAWVSSRLAIELVESEQVLVFAQMVRLDGSRGYKSVLLVPKTSPIDSTAHLLGRPGVYRFASGGTKSMSGFLVPNYFLFAKRNIVPEKHFSAITHGSHLENFLAVAEGRTDVATNNTEELPRYQAEMPEKFARVRVLWESPLIPNDPIVYRKDLPAETQQRIKKFFVAYGRTPEEKTALNKINGLAGFKSSSNYQLRPVVDLELFEALTKAMRENAGSPEAFNLVRQQLTKRAARLEVLMSSTRLDN